MTLPDNFSVFDQRNRRELAALKAENVLMRLRIPLKKPPASAPEVVLSVFNGHAMDAGAIMSAIAARGESISPRRLSDAIIGLVRSGKIVNNRKCKWKGEYVRVLLVLISALCPLTSVCAAVESSTNLTEWAASSAPWDQVLEMARTNPATPGNPHYYYRLSPEAEPSQDIFFPIPQDLAWNYVTNLSGDKVWWASVPTNWVQLSETTWAINNPAKVFYAPASNAPAEYLVESSTSLTEWTSSALRPPSASDGFHAARSVATESARLVSHVAARHVEPQAAPLTLSTNNYSVTLNWSPAVDIAGQRLYCDVQPNGRRQKIELPALENRHRLAGLTNGQPYWLELVSVSESGAESLPLRRSLSVEIKE